ncbi:dienelactone hydrolase family protein [Streptomyces sp. S6]
MTEPRIPIGRLALPPAGRGPAVLVAHDWWGLTGHVTDVTERLAAEGFVAFAPDLYGGLPVARGVELLTDAADLLLAHPAVTAEVLGTVGFGTGAGLVLHQAAQDSRVVAAVSFYGVPQDELPDFFGLNAEILGHYDTTYPRESLDALRRAISAQSGITPDLKVHAAYDAQAFARAWEGALAFLREHLG